MNDKNYIDFKYSFSELKNKIDLINFFEKNFPLYEYEKNKKGYVLKNSDNKIIDIVIFFNDNGTQKFLNVITGHGGDLLNLIKNYDLIKSFNSNKNYYYNLNVFLHNYINSDMSKSVSVIDKSKRYNDRKLFFNYFEQTQNISKITDIRNNEFVNNYLNYRKINLSTLTNKFFKDKIFILKQINKSNNVEYSYFSTKIQRLDNFAIVGLTKKNRFFKGIVDSSLRGSGFFLSNYSKDEKIKSVYINEGWEDSVSVFELSKINEKDNVVFLASNGSFSQQQYKDIATFINSNNIPSINLCNDNDIIGTYYNLGIISNLTENLKFDYNLIRKYKNNVIDGTVLIQINVTFTNLDKIDKSSFLKLTDNISSNFNNSEISSYKKYISEKIDTSILENELIMITKNSQKNSYRFYIPYKTKALQIFNKYIVKTDNSQNLKINIKIPSLSDFNDVLKNQKNNIKKNRGKKL